MAPDAGAEGGKGAAGAKASPGLEGRCGTCGRFVRVTETIDENGEVRRTGQCLLGVWSTPLYETSTCTQHIRKGHVREALRVPTRPRHTAGRGGQARAPGAAHAPHDFTLPEEITEMDAEEFRQVLRDVLRDELGVSEVPIAGRWEGGEVILRPGREGTADKRIPIDSLFHKIIMIRDRLRVLEQKLNAHPRLSAEDKLQMQQYVTQCYGSLTTFNVLFAERAEGFIGQKGDRDD
jgi:hypothetical protein